MPKNPERRTAFVWLAILALSVFAIFAPFVFGMDGMDGGYAIALISVLFAVTSVVVAVMYLGRARALDHILAPENWLAHWQYIPEEWQAFAEKEYAREKSEKTGLFMLLAVVCLIIGVIFALTQPDGGWVVLAVLGIVLAVAGLVAFITTRYAYWSNRKFLGETYITREGVYIHRQLHLWKHWGSSFGEASYDEADRTLAFRYSVQARGGRTDYTLRVPVPLGKEAEARRVLSVFQPERNMPSGAAEPA